MQIKTKDEEILDIYFQQYETGLYVAIYLDGQIYDQFGFNGTKEEFITYLKFNEEIEVLV